MEFIKVHQLNIMQAFVGVCAAMVFMLIFTKALAKRRRMILLAMEIAAFLLLLFDRYAIMFSGDPGPAGYVMVRVSNFIVFFMTSAVVLIFNIYLFELLKKDCGMTRVPTRLYVAGIMMIVSLILVVIAHFTGLYYTFDEMNRYHRAPAFVLSYLFPVAVPIIQLSVIYRYRKLIGKWIYISIIIFIVAPLAAGMIQLFIYGIAIVNIVIVISAMILYIFAYLDINEEIEEAHRVEIEYLEDEKKAIRRLFDKTVKSFINALDGRYVHTQGHSLRVAEYSKKIAQIDGKNEDECDQIYYAALLHDVGRIWMSDDIVKNLGNLSEEDMEKVRQMPVIGSQILSGIDNMPNLDVGAHYHCERYDGKGYPDGLAGDRIPEAARIIAAADAYDLMASECDLNPPMPPQLIRNRIAEESGAQLDPKYAKIIMQVLDSSDMDTRDLTSSVSAIFENEFYCKDYRDHTTAGIAITEEATKIRLTLAPQKDEAGDYCEAAMILFDSYDGRVHEQMSDIETYRYTEFGEVWFDGHIVCTGARNMEVSVEPGASSGADDEEVSYEITAYRQKDHVRIIVESDLRKADVVLALPDSSLYAYLALTGEHCHASSITIEKLDVSQPLEEIKRIEDPVSYIDRLESDIPNVQIDGKRTASTLGVPVTDGMRLDFHTMSLPSSDLIWHCPYIVLFTSGDGTVGGEGYREYALIRLNGETKKTDEISQNVITVDQSDDFVSWDKWKERNRKGYECEVLFRRLTNKITVSTDNAGVAIENVTTILDGEHDIYVAITGDQCAITDIRIR